MEFTLRLVTSLIDVVSIVMITLALAQSTADTKRSAIVMLGWMSLGLVFSIIFMWR